MQTYPTPPSSSGDSPPVYFVASPGSNSFSPPSHLQTQISIPDMDVMNLGDMKLEKTPRLKFIEQPINKFRFRYKSEMAGTHGSLCGINSDKSRKQTYPTVRLEHCTEKATVRCSIYQYNVGQEDMKPHPHRLIMKRGREEFDDPHDITVGPEEGFVATFHSMGIIHTARKNIVNELVRKKTKLQEELIGRMYQQRRGLNMQEITEIKRLAEQESKSINLNIVCLRFDAFIVRDGIYRPICEPIFSHGINNLKCALTGDLKIVRMDHCTSQVRGGKEIFLLVERVTKKNIKIRFYQLDDDEQEIWEGWGKFSELDVHHQYAIVFKTPPYKGPSDVNQPINVFMELVRPSDNARSESKEFRYVPNNEFKPGTKRPRSSIYSSNSYNSSSLGSTEIPLTVPNMADPIGTYPDLPNSWNSGIFHNSEQFLNAIKDVNSDEFTEMYNLFEAEYPEGDFLSNVRDGLSVTRKRNYSLTNSVPDKLIKMEVLPEDIVMADGTYSELKSFVKSEDAQERAPDVLHHYLGTDKKTNALHVFVGLNKKEQLVFLLKMIYLSKQWHLTNVRNSDLYSPLHIAVLCKNEEFVSHLLKCHADIRNLDGHGNTALHTAVDNMSGMTILDMLLSNPYAETLVDTENDDGETPLSLAIEKRNMNAVKLLCKYGASVNRQHRKSGFTPLRMAVENQWSAMIKFLLSQSNLVWSLQNDFKNVSPFEAASNKDLEESAREMIMNYAIKNDIQIKQEKEDDDESDEEMEEEIDIKPEIMTIIDDPELLYDGITKITPKCLDELSSILDASGKCYSLAELLDLNHLISSGAISSVPSLSKNLLLYAIQRSNVKILEIRNFLDNLDEVQGVVLLDDMARGYKHSS
ncbi:nuclear factor NF-kappa-B p110 subunit isoform X2 [Sitophilus oryzae]|nr:nuclear factor NF-kappa-B p110 subunit isoform X2 [Sitophilus oryzae]XP_030761907.1 nuclear factor NF-kappa-B p110 subunit isoform X2 [Sitophilus oryzae]